MFVTRSEMGQWVPLGLGPAQNQYWRAVLMMDRAPLYLVTIRDVGLWDRVREVVTPVDVGTLTGSPEGESAAEARLRELRSRRLARHRALADADGAASAEPECRRSQPGSQPGFVKSELKGVFGELAEGVGMGRARHLHGHCLGRNVRRSQCVGVLAEPGGLESSRDLVTRIAHGVYS